MAAALVAVAHNPAASRTGGVLVELDPAGGDVELLAGGRLGEPSLLAAVREARRSESPLGLGGLATEVRPGLRAVLAPVAAQAAGPAVEAAVSIGATAAAGVGWLVTDAGRWEPTQPSAARLDAADVVAVVCRSTVTSIAHARDLLVHLRGRPLVVVVVGDEPYGPVDLAAVVDAPVLGPVAWDPSGVSELWSGGPTRRWLRRRPLARSARGVLDAVAGIVDGHTSGGRGDQVEPSWPVETAR